MKALKKIIVFVICSFILQNCLAQGPSTHSVYRATSTDGINFVKDPNLLFFPASVPGAIKDTNDKIFIYYVYATQTSTEVLNVATSTDGEHFTTPQLLNLTGSTVTKRVDPNPVLLPDGRIRLYYINLDPTPPKDVHSAISTDGLNFTEEAGIRFTKSNITDPDVFLVNDSLWVMLVSKGSNLVRATSTDGLTFTEDATFTWNNGAVCSTFLFPGDTLRTYFCSSGIKSAVSTDGDNLTIESGIRISQSGNEFVGDPTLVHLGSTYIMYYKTFPLTTGIVENSISNDHDIVITQDYNSIIFQFNNSQKENYTLKIYDVTGKLIYTSENISSSQSMTEKNAFQNGVYICKLFNEKNIVGIGKFIIE
jgi:hypothetical protein